MHAALSNILFSFVFGNVWTISAFGCVQILSAQVVVEVEVIPVLPGKPTPAYLVNFVLKWMKLVR